MTIIYHSKDNTSNQEYSFDTVNFSMDKYKLKGDNHLNTMNKYNIEVGDKLGNDTVTGVDSKGITFQPQPAASTIYNWQYLEERVNKGDYPDWKLTKMNKKIIGYALLKDTPDTKAGQVFKPIKNKQYSGISNNPEVTTDYEEEFVVNNPEWFSPIYEEIKPSEVYVDTLAGKVKITKNVVFIGSDNMSTISASKIMQEVVKSYTNTLGGYIIKVETFKVGCKTFHISDISKIEEAIKQVS